MRPVRQGIVLPKDAKYSLLVCERRAQREPKNKVNKSSAVAEMGDRLATIDMGRKVGVAVPLSVGDLGPHLTQCCMG